MTRRVQKRRRQRDIGRERRRAKPPAAQACRLGIPVPPISTASTPASGSRAIVSATSAGVSR